MEIKKVKETKANLVVQKIRSSGIRFSKAQEPVLEKLNGAGIKLNEKQRIAASVSAYLSPREKRKWERMSESRKGRIIERALRRSGLELSIEKAVESVPFSTSEEIKAEKKTITKGNNRGTTAEAGRLLKTDKEKSIKDNNGENKCAQGALDVAGIKAHEEKSSLCENGVEKASKTTAKVVRKGAETGIRAAGAAATAGTTEVVHAVKKAISVTKKVASAVKRASDTTKKVASSSAQESSVREESGDNFSREKENERKVKIPKLARGLLKLKIASLAVPLYILTGLASCVAIPTTMCSSIGGAVVKQSAMAANGFTADVEKWRETVRKYCAFSNSLPLFVSGKNYSSMKNLEFDLSEWVDVILSMIAQESGGVVGEKNISTIYGGSPNDIMQAFTQSGCEEKCNDYFGHGLDVLTTDEDIAMGIYHLYQNIKTAEQYGIDDQMAIVQAYNFGPGFLSWLRGRGEKYTVELANEYSLELAAKNHVSRYGTPEYAEEVFTRISSSWVIGESLQALMPAINECLGTPYEWGGATPGKGMDCSGFTQYVFLQSGISLPHSAQGQYKMATPIQVEAVQPGDLVFLHTYTDASHEPGTATHVGIYAGDGKYYNASSVNSEGHCVTLSNLNIESSSFLGFGRVAAEEKKSDDNGDLGFHPGVWI